MKEFITTIGSRETPIDICNIMSLIGARLQNKYILRSGGAIGADKAFEKNVKPENKYIYTVEHSKRDVGGSRIAIRCALKHGIKVHNLVNPETLKTVKTWLNIV